MQKKRLLIVDKLHLLQSDRICSGSNQGSSSLHSTLLTSNSILDDDLPNILGKASQFG